MPAVCPAIQRRTYTSAGSERVWVRELGMTSRKTWAHGVAVVVHVGFEHDAIDATDDALVILMEGELDVGFAELGLLPTGRRAGVEEAGVDFDGELSGGGGDLDLIDEGDIAPGEEAVLCGGVG